MKHPIRATYDGKLRWYIFTDSAYFYKAPLWVASIPDRPPTKRLWSDSKPWDTSAIRLQTAQYGIRLT